LIGYPGIFTDTSYTYKTLAKGEKVLPS